MNAKKTILAAIIFAYLASAAAAQSYITVPVSDPVYEFLETAQLMGIIAPLPTAKPYSRSLVARSLAEVQSRRSRLSPGEQSVIDALVDRYPVDKERGPWQETGAFFWEDDHFPGAFGMSADMDVAADMADLGGSGGELGGSLYLRGDVGSHVSYNAEITAHAYKLQEGTYQLDPGGWEPYTYSKDWDGGLHPITGLGAYRYWTGTLSFGMQNTGEISASFFDDRLDLRFGRFRHEWGYGEGSLYLDGNARPFVAFEGVARPWPWLDFSFLTGSLEYYPYPDQASSTISNPWIKTISAVQQNNYSIIQFDVRPTKWLSVSVWDAAVWLKRMELGYPHPFISQFNYQNLAGDFDNLMLGGSIAIDWPSVMRSYASVFLDEVSFGSGDLWGLDRNMFAIQAGVKVPLPGLPWSRLTFQYTKIEPYCYTHPPTSVPWYDDDDFSGRDAYTDGTMPRTGELGTDPSLWTIDSGSNMESSYLNAGEPLGYRLDPNSDEFLIKYQARPHRDIAVSAKYRMIRHGAPDDVDGSAYTHYIPYNTDYDWEDDPYYRKSFLKDGIYEWYHIFTVKADFQFLSFTYFPAVLGLEAGPIFLYHTNYEDQNNWKIYEDSGHQSEFRFLVNLTFRVFP